MEHTGRDHESGASIPGRTLRIATFNVLSGDADTAAGSWAQRRPLIRRAIEVARPDILGLQEVVAPRLEEVAELVAPMTLVPGPGAGPPCWPHLSLAAAAALDLVRALRVPTPGEARARREAIGIGEHLPIAYRADRYRLLESGGFWISSTPDRPRSLLPFAQSPFLVHWLRLAALDASGPMLVLNAHLGHAPWHHAPTARIVVERVRALVADGGRGADRDDTSVYLVGDFNATPSSRVLRLLRSSGLVDVARAASQRSGPRATFHWGWGSERLGLTLDFVLAQSALEPRRADVVDVHDGRVYPSDHHLLVAELAPRYVHPIHEAIVVGR